jgi:hypothetical protein
MTGNENLDLLKFGASNLELLLSTMILFDLHPSKVFSAALLRYNSHTTEFTHLKLYNSVFFKVVTELYKHHHNPISLCFISLKETPDPLVLTPSPLHLQLKATTNLLSVPSKVIYSKTVSRIYYDLPCFDFYKTKGSQ